MTIELRVATQNIPAAKGQAGDLSRAKTQAVARGVDAEADIAGFQELSEVEDHLDLAIALPQKDWYLRHPDSENEVAARRSKLRILKEGDPRLSGVNPSAQVHLSDGKLHVSPERNAVWDVWEFVEDPTLTVTALLDFHLISGVYPGNDNLAWRTEQQQHAMEQLVRWVAYLVNRGINVLWVADTNWHTGGMPKLHPNQQWLVDDSIDKIAFVPCATSNYELTLASVESHKNDSDHMLRVANLQITPVVKSLEQQVEDWIAHVPMSAVQANALRAIVKGR